MGQIYSFSNEREGKEKGHCSFDVTRKDVIFDEASTYAGVLKVFREAFHSIDFAKTLARQ